MTDRFKQDGLLWLACAVALQGFEAVIKLLHISSVDKLGSERALDFAIAAGVILICSGLAALAVYAAATIG